MIHHRRTPALTVLLTLLLALAGPAAGQIMSDDGEEPAGATGERWWQVELVVFRYTDSTALQEEAWPEQWPGPPSNDLPSLNELLSQPTELLATGTPAEGIAPPAIADAMSPAPTSDAAYPSADGSDAGLLPTPPQVDWFLATPVEERRLSSQTNQLRRSGGAAILLHQSWRHHLRADGPAIVYRLVAGRELSGQGPDVAVDGLLPTPAPSPLYGTPEPALDAAGMATVAAQQAAIEAPSRHYQLEGTLAFDLHRFLHVTTDLWLTLGPSTVSGVPPGASTTGNDHATRYVHHQETRRMRSGEIHYLDNPLLGVIVLVTPWQKPLDVTDTTGAAEPTAPLPGD